MWILMLFFSISKYVTIFHSYAHSFTLISSILEHNMIHHAFALFVDAIHIFPVCFILGEKHLHFKNAIAFFDASFFGRTIVQTGRYVL